MRIHHIGALGELRDEGGHFRAAYEVPPGHWVLVRPDGHIGAMVSDTHRAELEAHLESLGLAGMDKVCAA